VEYDEEQVLAEYLFTYAQHRMTEVELRADEAAMDLIVAARRGLRVEASFARQLREKLAHGADPAVAVALADGYEAFRLRVVLRLLADPEVVALINRCPACSRIVRTPKARQCFWCGHDWHRRDAAQPGPEPTEEQ
jgi:hypothetical protein